MINRTTRKTHSTVQELTMYLKEECVADENIFIDIQNGHVSISGNCLLPFIMYLNVYRTKNQRVKKLIGDQKHE